MEKTKENGHNLCLQLLKKLYRNWYAETDDDVDCHLGHMRKPQEGGGGITNVGRTCGPAPLLA